MKMFIAKMKDINKPILKVLFSGLKFSLVLALFATFILSLYHSVHNIDLFFVGISLIKSALFFAVFFVMCAIAVDTIKKSYN